MESSLTRSTALLAEVDLKVANMDFLGQGPIILNNASPHNCEFLQQLRINKQYGRFGNNFYQSMHALTIAQQLGIKLVIFPEGFISRPFEYAEELGLSVIASDVNLTPEVPELAGAFYAPTGFEALFLQLTATQKNVLIRAASDHLYGFLKPASSNRQKILALHFRAGDLFAANGANFSWYVQPPASFYIAAIEHAVSDKDYDFIDLVYEDQTNPALSVVEHYLRSCAYTFKSQSFDLVRDVSRLISASTLIASFGTFVEAAALISETLESYYAFRSVPSQIDFNPFLQTCLSELLQDRRVDVYCVRDLAVGYISPKSWSNTDQQKAIIMSYPKSNLRVVKERTGGSR